MANPSKKNPWILEMKPEFAERWYSVDAYRDQELAQVHLGWAQSKQMPVKTEWRIRNFNEGEQNG